MSASPPPAPKAAHQPPQPPTGRPRLRDSLRMRLLAGTLAWIILTVALAGWGLRNLFQEHIHQQLQTQLVQLLDQLSASVGVNAQGQVTVQALNGDARLSQPLSGLYWQVDQLAAQPGDTAQPAVARSRSLWDQELDLPTVRQANARGDRVLQLHDPQGKLLLAVARRLQLPEADAPPLRLTVAADAALVAEPLQRFTTMLLAALLALAAGLAVAVVIQLQLTLRPLQLLRQRLAAVRTGEAARMDGQFPQELQPLVTEFNHVLGENAAMVQRARTQAGNLAHAVHTPLSILGNAAAQDGGPLAQLVQEQVATARRQVDYHLARARAAAAIRATGLRTPVLAPLQALLRTMERLHAERALDFRLDAPAAELAFRGEEQDWYEMLGNLLDNAGKWADSAVQVTLRQEGDLLCCTVDDDGPGIDAAQRERMFERGVRLDEQRPGSGLGLDIVRELAQTYGGRVQADASPLGGLRMQLWLPAAAPRAD